MALKLPELAHETTATTGTGTFTLDGTPADTPADAFTDVVGDGNKVFYHCFLEGAFEVGYGTLSVGGSVQLSRDRVIRSSNAGSKVDFGEGSKTVIAIAAGEWLAGYGFHVHKGGTDQTGISEGVDTQVTWATEVFDQGGIFASHAATIAVPGKYLFTATVQAQSMTTPLEAVLKLRRGGTAIHWSRAAPTVGLGYGQVTVTAIVDCAAGDVIDVACDHDSSSTAAISGGADRSYFMGFKVGA